MCVADLGAKVGNPMYALVAVCIFSMLTTAAAFGAQIPRRGCASGPSLGTEIDFQKGSL